jgi:hypothetical protein
MVVIGDRTSSCRLASITRGVGTGEGWRYSFETPKLVHYKTLGRLGRDDLEQNSKGKWVSRKKATNGRIAAVRNKFHETRRL